MQKLLHVSAKLKGSNSEKDLKYGSLSFNFYSSLAWNALLLELQLMFALTWNYSRSGLPLICIPYHHVINPITVFFICRPLVSVQKKRQYQLHTTSQTKGNNKW